MKVPLTQIKPIYTGPTGRAITEFSHSQFTTYSMCPRRYYYERVKGYRQKPGASLEFGKAIEESVRSFYQERRDPVELFEILWNLQSSNVSLQYPDGDDWKTFHDGGVGLMIAFRKDWQRFPPRNPSFPDYKHRSRVTDATSGVEYATIPDLIDSDANGYYMADLKCLKQTLDLPLPHQVILDGQLRTQAAVMHIYRVALWNFCRNPKRVDRASAEEILGACGPDFGLALRVAHDANDLNFEETAAYLGPQFANHKQIQADWKTATKANPSLKETAEKITAAIRDKHKPVYVIQWVEGVMPEEHAMQALRHEMSVVPLIQLEYFPRVGGVRFPENQCTWCPTRGLCLEDLCGSNPEYDKITSEELVKWDDSAMEGL